MRHTSPHRLPVPPPGWLLLALLVPSLVWPPPASAQKRLERDDEVVVFQSMARRDGDGWIVPARGRVYEPEHSVVRRRLVGVTLDRAFDIRPDASEEDTFAARVDLFVADGEGGRHVRARIAGATFEVGASDSNGYFARDVTLDAAALHPGDDVQVTVLAPEGDDRVFTGSVIVPGDEGLMVVSDIDDTVKISHVTDRARMLESTFFREFAAVPGMADLYRRWRARGAGFHYVSSSPWQLYVPLRDFLEGAGFPAGAFHLKTAHLTDETVVEFFAKGTETKPAQIEPLLAAYPRHRFVLVGDSGEQDPEVYAGLLARHPHRIAGIYIRNVTAASRDDERFSTLFAGVPAERWHLFTDPAAVPEP